MLKIALQVWSLGPVFSIAGNLLLHIILNRKTVQEIFLVSAKTRLTSRMDLPFMTALFSPTPAFPVRKQHEPGWAQSLHAGEAWRYGGEGRFDICDERTRAQLRTNGQHHHQRGHHDLFRR